MTLGEQLKSCRQGKGWTQPEAAEAIGIEQSYLSKLENGKSLPSADLFDSLLQGYQVDVAALIEPLSPKQQHALKSIPAVADYLSLVQRSQVQVARKWLVVALASFAIGVFSIVGGQLGLFAPTYVYIYKSSGVVKEGESPSIFEDWRSYVSFMDNKEMRKLTEQMHKRQDEAIEYHYEFRGTSYVVDVDGGKRRFIERVGQELDPRLNRFMMAIGAMFLAVGAFSIYLTRKWK